MRTVTHREMRNSSGEILRAVAGGESVQVTNNGQIAAVISPPNIDALTKLLQQGQLRPPRQPISTLTTIQRRRSDFSSADLIADARGQR